jgi:hypothetical protein
MPKNGAWSTAQFEREKAIFDRGVNLHVVVVAFEIRKSSLLSHIVGIVLLRKREARSVLSPAKEQQLVDYILAMQDLRFSLAFCN